MPRTSISSISRYALVIATLGAAAAPGQGPGSELDFTPKLSQLTRHGTVCLRRWSEVGQTGRAHASMPTRSFEPLSRQEALRALGYVD